MMIKVGDEYLDFDDDIELERRAKLFTDITENNGDYSYEFRIPDTTFNRKQLVIQDINITGKIIYNNCNASVYSNSGGLLYYGFLKVERIEGGFIHTSFFSGNTNWITLLPSNLSDVDFSDYNVKLKDTLTAPTITEVNEGIIFPFVDNGLLETRLSECLIYDDLVPWIYVKTVVETILSSVNIKLAGNILQDPIYNKLKITSGNNEWFQAFVEARSISVRKDSTQFIATSTMTVITFTDDSFPEFIGTANNYSTSTNRYIADVDMTIELDLFLSTDDLFTADSGVWKNGVNITNSYRHTLRTVGTEYTFHYDKIPLLAGDYIDVRMQPLGDANIYEGSYLKIKPVKFATVYANSVLPNMSTTDFLNGIFELFNTIIDYEPFTKTISINLFKSISKRTPQDLSEYLVDNEDEITKDFFTIVDNYGINNTFSFSSSETDRAKDYKRRNSLDYGSGKIVIDNKYIQQEVPIIESDFIAGINYNNEFFKNIMHVPILTYEEDSTDIDISSVTDVAGVARFNCAAAHDLEIGDIVRLSEFDDYDNGEGVVTSLPSSTQFVIYNLTYAGSSTGKARLVSVSLTDSGPYIGLVNPKTASSDIGLTNYAINNSTSTATYTELNYGWFQKPLVGFGIDNVLGDLSFGEITLEGFTVKVNMIDNYFTEFKNILDDPLMVIADFVLPEKVYLNLSFAYPVVIKSNQVNGVFYLNKITGYINSYTRCAIELIKLP